MNQKVLDSLASALHRRREELFREVIGTEEDLRFIGEDRESELEERAQEERLARLLVRLDDRAKREIEQIAQALGRIASGAYGTCDGCGRKIPLGRLRALPATRLCVKCAQEREASGPAGAATEEGALVHRGRLGGEIALLTDRELEGLVREQIHDDGRIDTEELRVVCRRGVVYVDGTLPSEAEHRILLHLLTDVIGLEEVVDHVRVNELLWERDERSKEEAPSVVRVAGIEPAETEDIVESTEEGIDFVPPTAPVPEEEE